jgi:hypothetical protein
MLPCDCTPLPGGGMALCPLHWLGSRGKAARMANTIEDMRRVLERCRERLDADDRPPPLDAVDVDLVEQIDELLSETREDEGDDE